MFMARRYDAAGTTQGSEFRVNGYTSHNQDSPAVAMDFSGDFVVAWSSYFQDGSYNGIYAQRYHETNIPAVDLNGPSGGLDLSRTFVVGDGPVSIADVAATVTDLDSTHLVSLAATIVAAQVGDILTADTAGTAITASFDGTTLLLSGLDTVEHYQQVLRTIKYDHFYGPITLGTMGNSLTDEYLEQPDGAYAENWVEQLVEYAGVDVGPTAAEAGQPGGTWGSPRRTGYQYNWARSGDDTSQMLSHGQHTGLAAQIEPEGIGYTVLMIGSNEFRPGGPGMPTTTFTTVSGRSLRSRPLST